MKYTDTSFKNSTVELDGNEFHGCDFRGCVLIYRGGEMPVLANNSIAETGFEFKDAALRTLAFLRALHRGGFAPIVDATLNNIRGDTEPDDWADRIG